HAILRMGTIVVGLVAAAVLATAVDARAQAGATIDFIVPADTPITPSGVVDAGDVVVITGQPTGLTSTDFCTATPSDNPVQDAVVIDPGAGQRATRVSGIIPVSQTTAIAPGTKLGNLEALPPPHREQHLLQQV